MRQDLCADFLGILSLIVDEQQGGIAGRELRVALSQAELVAAALCVEACRRLLSQYLYFCTRDVSACCHLMCQYLYLCTKEVSACCHLVAVVAEALQELLGP